MKKIVLFVIVTLIGLSALTAHAGTYAFQPNPSDLWELDHSYYYKWGINWNVPAGETVTGASIFIDNINNDLALEDDILFINLLDNPTLGTSVAGIDLGDFATPSNFFGTATQIATFQDTNETLWGLCNPAEDWTYTFTSAQVNTLNSYLATTPGSGKGNFGLGFDPDCHYNNCGITFTVTTSNGDIPQNAVPEPMSIMLGALGLGSIAGFRRLRGK